MSASFVHLHVHTEYSLLDGFSNIKKLVKRAKEMGMPALAITDHGTMYGVVEFFNAARNEGVKPIIGLETYMAARGMRDRDAKLDKKSYHTLLLAENETGYRNLLKIASAAQLEGFYYHPRIDRDFLAAHSEGLICTTGCMSAEIPVALLEENPEEAVRRMNWYYDVFGRDRFFVELQQHNIKEITDLNRRLLELGARYSMRYVATNDVHYINPEEARLQDILLAIQTGSVLSDPNRLRMTDPSYYLRTPQEMADIFKEVPEALSNTLMIAERCKVDLSFRGYHLPEFPVPEGHTPQTYLRALCEEGCRRRYGGRASDPQICQRLDYELGVVHDMGFDAYFLIVWDLCRHARERGIWYNARGSAAGSMIAYTLEITLVDPIEHGLIFERFLNPGRISMPDIDLDFRDDRRAEMLEYAAQKYGDDRVAQIITFGTMGARAAIRDVGRVMDIPLNEVDRITKLIPNIPGKTVTIKETLEQNPEFRAIYESSPHIKELIDTASQMEGVVRSAGTHAAGVVIADQPLIEYLPLHRPTSGAEDTPIKSVTQFEMGILDSLGMLKVDFLGLSTLTVMARACELIEKKYGKKYNLGNIPLDDPKAFELMGNGQTAGVFQLEGSGMTRYLIEMKPQTLEHVIAMVALYRPGPMAFIPSYIKRMHGEEQPVYRHEALRPIYESTYGIPVYQEQLMRAAVELAGYTPSEADDLRKAISKKKKEDIEKHKSKFVTGAVAKGISRETAEAIYADWEEFARYGFNKCLPGDTEILDADTGRLVRIEDIYRGVYVLRQVISTDTDTLRLHPSRIARVMDNGIKPVYRLRTALGRQIEATANHPFYAYDGWKTLDQLQPGELIAVPRILPVEGQVTWPDHQVIALGHLLAEGNLCHPRSVYFYSQDDFQVQDFITAAECFENVRCSVTNHKTTWSVYARRIDRAFPPGIFLWAGELGILGKTASEKEIPAAAFELNNRQIALLLSRLWEGDGHLDPQNRSAFYATASERLARQMQHLFLRLGIVSRLRKVIFPYKEGRTGWQLYVTGGDNLRAFAQTVGAHFISAKNRQALETLLKNCPADVVSTKDIVPVAAKELVRQAKERTNMTWRTLNAESGIAQREFYPTHTATKRGFTRKTMHRLAGYFTDPSLRRLSDNDVYWDEIVSIEYVGKKQTYDLEVPSAHNFIANDIIVHNSHAADYGVIAVQTAYLKAHYPAEYMTALLSVWRNDTEKVALYVTEARNLGLEVLPPDINISDCDFTIEYRPQGTAIRFGLGAVKNVGQGSIDLIIKGRQDGPFANLSDLARRVDLRAVGKRALECLIKVGALDRFGPRLSLLQNLDRIIAASASHFRAAEAGQLSLFEAAASVTEDILLPPPSDKEDKREQLNWERELIGLYISDHPLTSIQPTLSKLVSHFSAQLSEAQHEERVRVAGLVVNVRPYQTKKGSMMGFVTLEDIQGNIELVLFPKVWQAHEMLLEPDKVVLVEGKVDATSAPPKILVDTIKTEINLVEAAEAPVQASRPQPTAPQTRRLAQPAAIYATQDNPAPEWDDDGPPPPEAFPPGWDAWEQPDGETRREKGEPAAGPVSEPPVMPQTTAEESSPQVMPPPILPPLPDERDENQPPRLLTIILRPNGDPERDRRRIKSLIGILISYPGRDRFEMQIFENGRGHLIDFPNHTTRICPELLKRLERLLGEETWRIEPITYQ